MRSRSASGDRSGAGENVGIAATGSTAGGFGRRSDVGVDRQVVDGDRAAFGQHHRALHHVAQLADVAGPLVAAKPLPDAGVDLGRRRAHPVRREIGEPARERLDLRRPLAQRRDLDRDAVEAEVEIAPERALVDRGFQVTVGGGQHANVDRARLRAAEPEHLPLLQHAQQLDLDRDRHLADLVEEEGAALRGLEQAGLGLDRAGERAALVAEQLALQQRRGERRAVEADERLVRSAATACGSVARTPPCRRRCRRTAAR